MKLVFLAMHFIFVTNIFLINSCIEVPFTVNFDYKLSDLEEYKDSVPESLKKYIKEKLEKELKVPPAVKKEDCIDKFLGWYDGRVTEGELPLLKVSAQIYGDSNTSACPNIDTDDLVKRSWEDLISRGGLELRGKIRPFHKERAKLRANNCIKEFTVAKNKKFLLTDITIVIDENSSGIGVPAHSIYYLSKLPSPSLLEKIESKTLTAKEVEDMLDQGGFIEFAKTKAKPAGFKGEIKVENISVAGIPRQVMSLAYPILISPMPELADFISIDNAGRKFFIFPKENLQAKAKLDIIVRGSLSDLTCALNAFNEKLKKE